MAEQDPKAAAAQDNTGNADRAQAAQQRPPDQEEKAQPPVRRDPRPRRSTAPTLWVMAPKEDNRVALYERHPAHPRQPDGTEGEVMVAGDGRAYEVGDTAAVRVAIREERLVEVDAGDAKALNRELEETRRQRRMEEMDRLREAAEVNRLEAQGSAGSR